MKTVFKQTIGLFLLTWLTVFIFCSKKTDISSEFVNIKDINPAIIVELKYASADNFLKKAVYPVPVCILRRVTAERLSRVQNFLEQKGYGLKIYDGYRPLSVQKKMWEILPDSRFVANPATGSRHNRGAAVDVTLVDKKGRDMEMPTKFDDFTEKAARDCYDLSSLAIKNRKILEYAMTMQGFLPLKSEWWHFDDPEWKQFDIVDVSLEEYIKKGN